MKSFKQFMQESKQMVVPLANVTSDYIYHRIRTNDDLPKIRKNGLKSGIGPVGPGRHKQVFFFHGPDGEHFAKYYHNVSPTTEMKSAILRVHRDNFPSELNWAGSDIAVSTPSNIPPEHLEIKNEDGTWEKLKK
jgi:hypothetical protein